MTDNTQELDEILAKHNGELGLPWEDPDVVTSDTKQALLDWHNKQTEGLLDRLAIEVRASDYIGIAETIQSERNKLKENKDE